MASLNLISEDDRSNSEMRKSSDNGTSVTSREQQFLFPAVKPLMSQGVYYEPLNRVYHIMQCVGGKAYLYGGLFDKKLPQKLTLEQLASTVQIFDPATEEWTSMPIGGESSAIAVLQVASTTLGGDLYTFGGADMFDCVTNYLHRLDTTSLCWYKLTPLNPEEGPIPKVGSGMVAYRHHLAVFGGFGVQIDKSPSSQSSCIPATGGEYANVRTNEFHLFDLHTARWIPVPMTGSVPPACSHFSLTQVSQRRAVLFGGFAAEIGCAVNAVHIIDLETMHWSLVMKSKGSLWPEARQSHAACCLNFGQESPQLLVSGGISRNVKKVFKDLWMLDIDSGNWKEVSKNHGARKGHSLVSVMLSPQAVVIVEFGGSAETDHSADQKKMAKTALFIKKEAVNGITRWMLDFCATPSVLAKQKCLKNYIACPKDIAVRDLACVQSTEKVQKQTVRSASNTSDIETESLMKHIHLLQCQLERAQMGQSVENERANQAEKLLKQEKETFKTSQVRAHQRISALEEMVSTLQERVREEQKKVIEAEKIVLKEQNRAMIAEEKARVLEKKIGDKTKIDDAVVQNSAEYFPARFRTVETQTDYVDCETDNGAEKSSAQTLTFPVMLAADMIKRANDRVLLAEERLKAALKCIDEVQAKTEDANYTAKRAAEMLHQIEQCTHVSDIDKLMSQNKKLKRE